MVMVVLDPDRQRLILRRRRAIGADHHDEVWNGVYVMSPDPDNRHQSLVFTLTRHLWAALGEGPEIQVFPGVNISDRREGWKKNYRVPDVAVFLPGNPAEDMEAFWFGGPDFAVEILSPHDRSRKKLDFYAKVGVRELLLIDRRPWSLELYRLDRGRLARAEVDPDGSLSSWVLPIRLRLADGDPTPKIAIEHADDGRRWLI